jgi:hypothetical protein
MATSSLTFSPKRGGQGRLKSYVRARLQIQKAIQGLLLLCFIASAWLPPANSADNRASSAAAASFRSKLATLEQIMTRSKSLPKNQGIRFTQDELNSYLALDLKPNYHPCLKSLLIYFEEGKIQGVADIDFDRLKSSSKLSAKLLSLLMSGTQTLAARGKLVSRNSTAYFQLENATFNGSTLPNSLVKTVITMVGRKQNPPFDPLNPSTLPYGIDHVEIHRGYATVYPK